MRHFYKLPVNMPNIPLMTEIMRRRDELFGEDGLGTVLPDDARRMALGILQITNGVGLLPPILQWLNHDTKHMWSQTEGDHYIAVLSGQIMCMSDDECPAMNAGEAWWVDPKHEAILINKSGDDAVLLHATVQVNR